MARKNLSILHTVEFQNISAPRPNISNDFSYTYD